MALQCKFFVIPVKHIAEAEEELNRFMRAVRVVDFEKEFVPDGRSSFWSVTVEYMVDVTRTDGKRKPEIDYRDVLSPEEFNIFAKLRDWRKAAAAAEAVKPFTLFTNAQLAQFIQGDISTKAAMEKVSGVGEARVKKYGDAVLAILNESRKPAPKNQSGGEQQGLFD